jgi:hypothetical protein
MTSSMRDTLGVATRVGKLASAEDFDILRECEALRFPHNPSSCTVSWAILGPKVLSPPPLRRAPARCALRSRASRTYSHDQVSCTSGVLWIRLGLPAHVFIALDPYSILMEVLRPATCSWKWVPHGKSHNCIVFVGNRQHHCNVPTALDPDAHRSKSRPYGFQGPFSRVQPRTYTRQPTQVTVVRCTSTPNTAQEVCEWVVGDLAKSELERLGILAKFRGDFR